MQITADLIVAGTGCGKGVAAKWLPPVQNACSRFSFDTPNRVAAFLAQIGVESASLTTLEENLNYSAERLAVVWPSRFAADPKVPLKVPNELAKSLARQPEKIANLVYSNRFGNGAPASGDGWKYRGRGLIQLTFKDNYRICGAAISLDLIGNPDILLDPTSAALSAAWFLGKLNPICLTYADAGDINSITKVVNGSSASDANHGPLRASRFQAALATFPT